MQVSDNRCLGATHDAFVGFRPVGEEEGHETGHKLADAGPGKAEGTSDGSLALFDQQASSSPKGQGKRDGKYITCGKKGRTKSKHPDGENEDRTRNEQREEKQVE